MAKILVIDDHASSRELYQHVLKKHGHEVHVANDGNAGVELCQTTLYDVIITDLFMPEKDGYETIAELKAKKPSIPIIAITGNTSLPNNLEIARMLGAMVTVKKTDSLDTLLTAVNQAIA